MFYLLSSAKNSVILQHSSNEMLLMCSTILALEIT